MCVVLGIEDEVKDAQPLNEPAPVFVCHVNEELMAEGTIAVDDQVPEDIEMSYDKDHPKVEKGSIFPTMIDCRRVVRQWTINEEFNLGTYRANKSRWMQWRSQEFAPWYSLQVLFCNAIETGNVVRFFYFFCNGIESGGARFFFQCNKKTQILK
jgi:hypothetical protein